MWHLSRSKQAFALAVAMMSLFLLPGSSQAEEGPYPGLPSLPPVYEGSQRNTYGWINAPMVGLAGSVPAKQWVRIPLSFTALNIDFVTKQEDDSGDVVSSIYDTYAFLVPSSADEKYGESTIVTARTVAFGSIPTEVKLQVRQQRDADDLPVGLHFTPLFTTYYALNKDVFEPASTSQPVEVAIVGLTVDGVKLPLATSCTTGPRAQLDVASKRLEVDYNRGDTFDQDVGFSGIDGGTLQGTLDIPAFSGCTTTSGDDVSPLLTSAISGPGNPVTVKMGILGCYPGYDADSGAPIPAPRGLTDPAQAKCQPDQNEKVKGIPDQLPIPDYAPGEQPAD